MALAAGNVINRENFRGVDYPFGVLFSQLVGYIFIDPEEPAQTDFWVYEEGQAPPPKERNRLKVKLPKGMFPYLYGVAVPRGVAPLQTQTLTATSVPIVYTASPLTGILEETGLGGPVALSTGISIGPLLTKIYDVAKPLAEASDSRNAYPLPGFDGGSPAALTENSYLKITSSAAILLSPQALKLKKPIRLAVVVAGWQKDPLTVSINDIGGWSTHDF